MTDITGLPWTDNYLLGHAPMDDTHREFVEIVDAMLSWHARRAWRGFPHVVRTLVVHSIRPSAG